MDTDYLAGDSNYLMWLGDGHIKGSIACDAYEQIQFNAYRLPEESKSSPAT